jgi:glutathione S-transferase
MNSVKPGDLVFFHSPQTRSTGVWVLLEELSAIYEKKVYNSRKGELDSEAYRKVNPMRKVPALVYKGVLVTEQPAVYTFAADLFPEAKLAPKFDDPMRAAYLRWMSFYGSCLEPAIVDKYQKNNPGGFGMSPYGDYETTVNTVVSHLEEMIKRGPFFLGESFTAVDVLWGNALGWILKFGMLPSGTVMDDYANRMQQRPHFQRVQELDKALADS